MFEFQLGSRREFLNTQGFAIYLQVSDLSSQITGQMVSQIQIQNQTTWMKPLPLVTVDTFIAIAREAWETRTVSHTTAIIWNINALMQRSNRWSVQIQILIPSQAWSACMVQCRLEPAILLEQVQVDPLWLPELTLEQISPCPKETFSSWKFLPKRYSPPSLHCHAGTW